MMRFRSRDKSGLSLLEVLISIVILSATLWAIQTAYLALLTGGNKNEVRQKALAAAESIFLDWKEKAKQAEYWDGSSPYEGISMDYFYRVELSSSFDDPLSPVSGKELNYKLLRLTVFYSDQKQRREQDLLSPREPLFVRLTGSVSR